VFLLFGNTCHSNSCGGVSQTRHHYSTHTSPDSIIIMNKVFGILLAGLVLVISTASGPSVAGNWNQNDEVTVFGDTGLESFRKPC
jgi:hypothetical protein